MLGHEAEEVCFCSRRLPAFPRSDSAASAHGGGLNSSSSLNSFSNFTGFRFEEGDG